MKRKKKKTPRPPRDVAIDSLPLPEAVILQLRASGVVTLHHLRAASRASLELAGCGPQLSAIRRACEDA